MTYLLQDSSAPLVSALSRTENLPVREKQGCEDGAVVLDANRRESNRLDFPMVGSESRKPAEGLVEQHQPETNC
jgi:hypothetical protein